MDRVITFPKTTVRVTKLGSYFDDELSYGSEGGQQTDRRFLVGLQGDDVLSSTFSGGAFSSFSGSEGVVFAYGGTGSDSYVWDGNGIFIIADLAGSNDAYYEASLSAAVTSFNPVFYAIDDKHLMMYNDGRVLIHYDYKGSGKIEHYYLNVNGLTVHYSHEEYVTIIENSQYWGGSYSSSRFPTFEQILNENYIGYSQALEDGSIRIAEVDEAKQIGRLYQAAFDRAPDVDGLNFWIDRWEFNLMDLDEIASHFINSAEFSARYGEPSNADYINSLCNGTLNLESCLEVLLTLNNEKSNGKKNNPRI
jgi:hypothetical protein